MAGLLNFNGPIVQAGQKETETTMPTSAFHAPVFGTTSGNLPVAAAEAALGLAVNDHDADDGVLESDG
jgi:acyl-coenzyme A thioesterase PaaI-like protein